MFFGALGRKADLNTRKIESHPEPKPSDQDLIDLAAKQTLMKDGTVYAADPEKVPGHGRVAASPRFTAGDLFS